MIWILNLCYGLSREALLRSCAKRSIVPIDATVSPDSPESIANQQKVAVEKNYATDRRLSELFLGGGTFAFMQLAFHLFNYFYIIATTEGIGWHKYTSIYLAYLNSGAPLFVMAYATNINFLNKGASFEHYAYKSKLRIIIQLILLITMLLALFSLLPPLFTHLMPSLVAFPMASLPTLALVIVLEKIGDSLRSFKASPHIKLLLLFIFQIGNMAYRVMSFQAGYNWMVLLYAHPVPVSGLDYIGIFALENSYRGSRCFFLNFADSLSDVIRFASHII